MPSFSEPLFLLKVALRESLRVETEAGAVLTGTLVAFDKHCNILLSDVQEARGGQVRSFRSLMVRGDSVASASYLDRTAKVSAK